MGRRKIPQTREELEAEEAYCEDQVRKSENQIKLYKNAYKTEERNRRTRRLCTEAGILEHFVPELKDMDDPDTGDFIRIAVTSEGAKQFLEEWRLRELDKFENQDTGEN